MIRPNELLNTANGHFINKNYKKALFLYSQLCLEFPKNEEYQIYSIMCDIGLEDSNRAQTLFDTYSILKDKNPNEALKYIYKTISAYDGDIDSMVQVLKDASLQAYESLEAINYDDFNELIKSRGSFKIAFEDIMFSTKVTINSKEQFFDFLNKLIKNNFVSAAYKYLDGYNQFFSYDPQVQIYYKILENKSNGNINK